MVREDLVNSAVSFLQDPSVAAAPVEQRTAFLRSKNLTQEEIDLSLQRAGSEPVTGTQPPQNYYQQQPQQYRPQQPQPQNAPPPYWQHPAPPPPELPRRDWRDWFIMATVLGGLSVGAYAVAKRYVVPLIAPPTPPQLEQDKADIDAQFDKAFALLDQLAADTETLKKNEQDRTERLDVALGEVEAVIGQMKDASKRRDDEGRRITDEVRNLKDMIPKAMESQKESQDQRLKDLAAEMKSLKTLISNRMSASAPAPAPAPASAPTPAPGTTSGDLFNRFAPNSPAAPVRWTPPASAAAQPSTMPASNSTTSAATEAAPPQADESKPAAMPDRSATSSPYGRLQNGRAAIPAWQMAAAKKNQEAKEKSGTVESASTSNAEGDAAAAS